MGGEIMIGKKNIVFGFIYLVFTAALGPYMLQTMFPDLGGAMQTKQKDVGYLQQLAANEFENPETMEPMSATAIAKANTSGILALSLLDNARAPINDMKGGPHAHGNLEAVLNIIAGLTLCFLAAPVLFKQIISWVFILGALLHSGMLYLRAFDVAFASKLLYLGPWFVLLGLLLMGIAAIVWLRPEVVKDR
jgi:hypothetical protein